MGKELSSSEQSLIEPGRREFVLCNQASKFDITVFTTEDSAAKYKEFKKISSGEANFQTVLNIQRSGLGVPLLLTSFNYLKGKHASIFKYELPEESRLFDKDIDRREICTVWKNRFSTYVRYKFDFALSEDRKFTICLFNHYRLPIGDTTEFPKGTSYRWTHDNRLLTYYKYSLFLLEDSDNSLTDNMDKDKYKLDSYNKLVGRGMRNFFKLPSRKPKDDHIPNCRLGKLECLRIPLLESNKPTAKLVIRTTESDNLDSILSVNEDDVIFLCMSTILKGIEDMNMAAEFL
ncbi:uncharacterized protein PRCAT00005038001 [Priceomyces carsonii]|uniref:uncharacterized protein n=1 Tax=Priceomyces carsonii TaxID=28549 RepID=UPI002EDA7CA3|nr:unnamed protein product [Priceomyces carsonii]